MRRGTSALVLLACTTGVLAAGGTARAQTTGSITGSVYIAYSMTGITGATVYAYSASTRNLAASATTDGSGAYTVAGLAPGSYYLRTANTQGYGDELYNGLPCSGGACDVTTGLAVSVSAGATTPGISFWLGVGGHIGGTVTDAATGSPLHGVAVWIYLVDYLGGPAAVAQTDAQGKYSAGGLSSASYYVRTDNYSGYLDEHYDNLPCPASTCDLTTGTAVSPQGGGNAGGVDFALAVGGRISGHVIDAVTGASIDATYVEFHSPDGTSYSDVGSHSWFESNGIRRYESRALPAGTYYVKTYNLRGYADEVYSDRPCPGGGCSVTTGTPVSVTPSAITGGIDFALAAGGSISGTVTWANNGTALNNVQVLAYRAAGSSFDLAGSTHSGGGGSYTIGGLSTGTYYLRTNNSSGKVDELHDNVACPSGACSLGAGTPVGVTAGSAATGVNFALSTGGNVTGRVTDSATGAPLNDVTVTAYLRELRSYKKMGSGISADDGYFTVRGLVAGTYDVRTSNAKGYLDELYNNTPCAGGTCALGSGTPVSVALGATTQYVDFTLTKTPGGTLQLGAETHTVKENAGSVQVKVTRRGNTAGAVTVTLSTGNGTAYKGSDYSTVTETVGFAAGDSTAKTVNIPIIDNGTVEADETFSVTLTDAAGGAVIGSPSVATVTIVDDDVLGGGTGLPTASERLSFDRDGRTDVAIYRPPTGQWYVLPSSTNFGEGWAPTSFGNPGQQDVPVWGDFDGDGRRDFAVYRPGAGTWFWLKSSLGNAEYEWKGWGVQAQGDVPVPGDYDGDGKTDPAVYRPAYGTWFVLRSASSYTLYWAFGWGQATDVPVPGDYDGDGRTDIAVFRPATAQWYVLPSSSGFAAGWAPRTFGDAGDTPVRGDFDGDGRRDFAVWRPSTGTWFWLESSTDNTTYNWQGWGIHALGDVPVPGDYDGDGKTDPTAYRPAYGTWRILKSTTGFTDSWLLGWGAPTDTPLGGAR